MMKKRSYLVTWTSDYGREDGTWRVITGEPGLAHAGAIVADQRGNFVVAHFQWILSIVLLVNWTVLTRRLMPLVDVRVPHQPTGMSFYIGRKPAARPAPCRTAIAGYTICIA